MSNKNNDRKKITVGRVYAVCTVLAVIIAIPAVAVTFIMHYLIRAEFFLTLAAGLITLFIAMGFGYKLPKKFVKVLSGNSQKDTRGITYDYKRSLSIR